MNKLQLIDADTLYYKPLAHPKMLIDGVLSDGLAILAGDSKIGRCCAPALISSSNASAAGMRSWARAASSRKISAPLSAAEKSCKKPPVRAVLIYLCTVDCAHRRNLRSLTHCPSGSGKMKEKLRRCITMRDPNKFRRVALPAFFGAVLVLLILSSFIASEVFVAVALILAQVRAVRERDFSVGGVEAGFFECAGNLPGNQINQDIHIHTPFVLAIAYRFYYYNKACSKSTVRNRRFRSKRTSL